MPKAYELPLPGEQISAQFKLGVLCKRRHDWTGDGESLRYNKARGDCVLCARIDALARQTRLRALDPEAYKARRRETVYRSRAKHGRESRSQYGFDHGFLEANGFSRRLAPAVAKLLADGLDVSQIKQRFALDTALRSAGRCPSVTHLVMREQHRRWREHPAEKQAHVRWWSAYIWAWRYKCDPAFRRHECQRASARKAKNRGNHTVRLGSKAMAARFAQFKNSCAYCGSTADLIVEHFIPRAQGGPHALGNILPACQSCNVKKSSNDPEQWYRAQPFFSKRRWHKILAVLGKAKAPVQQLPLL